MSASRQVTLPGNIVSRTCMEVCSVCEQLLRASLCMVTVSMETPLNGQAGFEYHQVFLAHLALLTT